MNIVNDILELHKKYVFYIKPNNSPTNNSEDMQDIYDAYLSYIQPSAKKDWYLFPGFSNYHGGIYIFINDSYVRLTTELIVKLLLEMS